MQTMQSAPAAPNAPVYSTVKQFSEKHPAFSVGSLRAHIFQASSNGLNESGAIVRVGRRILLSETKFFDWIEAQRGLKSVRKPHLSKLF
jgi:hypothetical protein